MGRLTFTARRTQLARRVDTLERMEERNMITESLGLMLLGIGVPAVAAQVGKRSLESSAPRRAERPKAAAVLSFTAVLNVMEGFFLVTIVLWRRRRAGGAAVED